MKALGTLILGVMLVSSTLLHAQSDQQMEHRQKKIEAVKENFKTLKKELDLTEDQSNQIKSLFEARRNALKSNQPSKEEMKAMSEDERKEFRMKQMKMRSELNQQMRKKIASLLTDEQKEKYRALVSENRVQGKPMQHRRMKMQETDQEENHRHLHRKGEEHQH